MLVLKKVVASIDLPVAARKYDVCGPADRFSQPERSLLACVSRPQLLQVLAVRNCKRRSEIKVTFSLILNDF